MTAEFPPAVIGMSPRDILRKLLHTHYHQPAICLFRALEMIEMRDLDFAAPILDLGCGNGDIGDLALRSHWPVHGLDLLPSEVRAAVARDAYDGATVGDATRLPYPDDSFGAVVSICVIEHIPDDLAAIAEVARVLRPGGRFAFSTPSAHFESQLLDADRPGAVGAVNETVGELPILAVAVADTRVIRTFARTVDDRLLTFDMTGGLLTDRETGTTWDPFSGAARTRPHAGRRLAQVPHTLSFDWAWQIFYPTSTYFPGYGQWETAPG